MNTKRYQLDYDLWQLFLNVLGEELVENEITFKEIVSIVFFHTVLISDSSCNRVCLTWRTTNDTELRVQQQLYDCADRRLCDAVDRDGPRHAHYPARRTYSTA